MADKQMKLPLHGFWSQDRGLSFFLAFLEGFDVVRVINLGSSRAPQPMARK